MRHAKRHDRANEKLRSHAVKRPDSPVPGAGGGDKGRLNGERIVNPRSRLAVGCEMRVP